MKSLLLLFVFSIFTNIQAQEWTFENSIFLSEKGQINLQKVPLEIREDILVPKLKEIETHFGKVQHLLEKNSQERMIPACFHFIWIGPKEFPEKMLANIKTWHKFHPKHEIFLWVDRKRDVAAPYITVKNIDEIKLNLAREYLESESYGEKSDILRYQILQEMGGVYVDVDVECHKSIDAFMQNYRFFAGLEEIMPMVDHKYLRLCNCVIGSAAHHPILEKTQKEVRDNWKKYTEMVNGMSIDWTLSDYLKTILVFYRTFLPFTKVTFSHPLEETDIIVPPFYFGMMFDNNKGIYCTHYCEGSWKPKTTSSDQPPDIKVVKSRLNFMYRNSVKLLIVCGLNILLTLSLLTVIVFFLMRQKKRSF